MYGIFAYYLPTVNVVKYFSPMDASWVMEVCKASRYFLKIEIFELVYFHFRNREPGIYMCDRVDQLP